jgi:hypothetical protein
MFIPIQPEDMVHGTKYKIDIEIEMIIGIYKASTDHFVRFSIHRSVDHIYPKTCDFYQFVSQNPKWKRDRRSVNMIVRRLIGDDYFEW